MDETVIEVGPDLMALAAEIAALADHIRAAMNLEPKAVVMRGDIFPELTAVLGMPVVRVMRYQDAPPWGVLM
jgi:hypothetical protein